MNKWHREHINIRTAPVTTLMEPVDHVPVIGVTLWVESYVIGVCCARAEADAQTKKARDGRSIGKNG